MRPLYGVCGDEGGDIRGSSFVPECGGDGPRMWVIGGMPNLSQPRLLPKFMMGDRSMDALAVRSVYCLIVVVHYISSSNTG